jgi:predicted  nucleic acid-binding Zn-ribbon protein
VNAEPQDQWRLLDLQEKDTRLSQLAHRAATLPEASALAELESRVARTRDELVAAEVIAEDLVRDQERAEADVEQVRARSKHDQELLNGGAIVDPKQLQNLQHEIESLARRQSELEDVELEIMDRVEGAQAAVAQLAGQKSELAAECEVLAETVRALNEEIDAEKSMVSADRARIAESIPADLLALYEKIRADHSGVGAARLYRGRCEGCRLELPPNEIEALRNANVASVVRCEECRRILVRTAESGL